MSGKRRLFALAVLSVACATREAPSGARAPVAVPVPQTTHDSEHTERSPSTGRIEGVFLEDDGVLAALTADELGSIARCHHAGRPFGWALLSVDAQRAVTLVEAEAGVAQAASCAQSSMSVREGLGEVLIYLRFL
jgi:hypothetical protein